MKFSMIPETLARFSSFWPGSSEMRMCSVSMAATTALWTFPFSSSQKSGTAASGAAASAALAGAGEAACEPACGFQRKSAA